MSPFNLNNFLTFTTGFVVGFVATAAYIVFFVGITTILSGLGITLLESKFNKKTFYVSIIIYIPLALGLIGWIFYIGLYLAGKA